jgi:hypothetical protein
VNGGWGGGGREGAVVDGLARVLHGV